MTFIAFRFVFLSIVIFCWASNQHIFLLICFILIYKTIKFFILFVKLFELEIMLNSLYMWIKNAFCIFFLYCQQILLDTLNYNYKVCITCYITITMAKSRLSLIQLSDKVFIQIFQKVFSLDFFLILNISINFLKIHFTKYINFHIYLYNGKQIKANVN